MTFEKYREAGSCANEPVQVIPIYLQRCSKKVGVSCNGSGSCVNSYATCDDKCSYECVIEEDTHTSCNTLLTGGLYRPSIASEPTVRGSKIDICEGMPQASEITVKLTDAPGCDYRDDSNRELRDHDGIAPGTELTKYKERHILEGRRFSHRKGYQCTNYPEDFYCRDFWIDAFDPSGECEYELKGKDALGFFNFSDISWPPQRSAKLRTTLTSGADIGSFLIIEGAPEDTQVICYKGEAIKVEHVRDETFRLVERAICNSTQNTSTIAINESVDIAGYLPAYTTAAEALYEFMHQKGNGLPNEELSCECGPFIQSMFDFASWRDVNEGCGKLDFIPETVVCKPTPVRQLVKEISAVFLTIPYVDRDTGKIALYKHEPPKAENAKTITEKMMVDCKLTKKKPRQVTTKTVFLSHPADCTKGVSDDNLSNKNAAFNESSFGDACTNPAWRPDKVKEIKTRFLGPLNAFHESAAVQRIDYMNRKPIQPVCFDLHVRDMDVKETDWLVIEYSDLQSASGGPYDQYFFVTQIDDLAGNCFRIYAETMGFDIGCTWATGLTCDAEVPVVFCPDSDGCTDSEGPKIF